ncbi:Bug family tripartite tricarboxylate transporter substrate binding protein [Cupriavidus necator]
MGPRTAIVLVALLCAVSAAKSQAPYPSKTITIVVPFGAGGGTDVITRIMADQMAKSMNAKIVVDNKPGASGQIGTEIVAHAKADGYTLLVATNSTHSGNPYLYKTLRYDPVKSFAPIGRMTINPLALLVRNDSPFKSSRDLVRFARDNPGKLSYGYGNTGGQVSAAMLLNMAQIKALPVPYKTAPQVFTDLMAGQIDFTFVDVAASKPLLDSGKIRALGVTSPKRVDAVPSVSALREVAGLEEYVLFAWLGLVAPAGTPSPIVDKLNRELRVVLEHPDVKTRLEQTTGSIVEPTSVDEFSSFMRLQSALWKRRIAEAGIQPE